MSTNYCTINYQNPSERPTDLLRLTGKVILDKAQASLHSEDVIPAGSASVATVATVSTMRGQTVDDPGRWWEPPGVPDQPSL